MLLDRRPQFGRSARGRPAPSGTLCDSALGYSDLGPQSSLGGISVSGTRCSKTGSSVAPISGMAYTDGPTTSTAFEGKIFFLPHQTVGAKDDDYSIGTHFGAIESRVVVGVP